MHVGFCPIFAGSTPVIVVSMNTRELTDKFQDWQKRATETARNMSTATDQYVRENTWTTVALAAIVGCVVGFLISGRRD
jgi:ElaB/YqjD/DUF883 family membrane-anchored ribosome-binding protein